MPNTRPVNDCAAVTAFVLGRAAEAGCVRVRPIGALTRGQAGAELADIGDLAAAGTVALSDDGRAVMNAELMRRALEYARTFRLPVVQHCEDAALAGGTVAHEGAASTRAGLRGQPAAAETAILARDLELVALTGARYHAAHLSAADSVRLVRDAKRRGLPVTAEVTPHHLTLTDEACLDYDTRTRVNPPLRAAADREALRDALADGTIDAVATDHAPHSPVEKEVEFDLAAPGMVGLETALPLLLDLVAAGRLTPLAFAERLTAGPARAFGLEAGRLVEGGVADLVLVDPDRPWTCDAGALRSKSRNTPWLGRGLRGRAVLTMVGGRVVHDEA
jgi:dihydroorotase